MKNRKRVRRFRSVWRFINGAAHLRMRIGSILAQTFTDFELLIADDGSTDDTCAIVSSYSDSRIHWGRNSSSRKIYRIVLGHV